MLYRFENNKIILAKYKIIVTEKDDQGAEIGKSEQIAVNDEEKNEIVAQYPDAEVSLVEASEYKWLEDLEFTQEQLINGELERAIEMGESEYKTYLTESNVNYHIQVLETAILELAKMFSEVNG